MTEDRTDERPLPPEGEHDDVAGELAELRERLDIPTRGAAAYTVMALVASGLAVWTVWPILTGLLGMVFGLIAHLKGHRFGFAAAIVAGLATVVGMSIEALLFSPFSE